MRYIEVLFLFLVPVLASPQAVTSKKDLRFDGKGKYISFNFFSVAEPQFALGPSAGIRLTARSEVFAEAAYVSKGLIGECKQTEKINGARLIFQYRYHFLQRWKPLINIPVVQRARERRKRMDPFMGVEFRSKPYSLRTSTIFVNPSTSDTLSDYSFRASSFTFGASLIFGSTHNLSKDGKWKLELSVGIGGKDRKVKLKNIPQGYKPYTSIGFREWIYIPPIYEDASGVLIPIALRIRYTL